MSTANFYDSDVLSYHGKRSGVTQMFAVPAGVKKTVKRQIHRNVRRTETLALQTELTTMAWPTRDLATMSPAELSEVADLLFRENLRADEERWLDCDDNSDLTDVLFDQLAAQADDNDHGLPFQVSMEEFGGLPDWLIAQMEATGGSAMEMLSILEAKPADCRNRNKMFAVTSEDDGYCED